MSYYTYILISLKRSGWSYVGSTNNLERRFLEHNNGKVRSTKGMRPLNLIYNEEYATREDALSRESYLKSGSGREEKQKIINRLQK